jgi:hypothetical protein
MTLLDSLTRGASTAGGAVLGAATGGLAAVRPARKPLHPSGRVVTGRLVRTGLVPATGVSFVDTPGDEEVVVRESRAIGLPPALPDIHGLALRVTNPDQSLGDLLFATTGSGRLSRFVLTASRTTYGRPMTTLLPYRTAAGPLLLSAHSELPGVVELACAVGTGPWRRFGRLEVSDEHGPDPAISFDPVLHRVAGLEQYATVTRLREPAYRTARRSRTSPGGGR